VSAILFFLHSCNCCGVQPGSKALLEHVQSTRKRACLCRLFWTPSSSYGLAHGGVGVDIDVNVTGIGGLSGRKRKGKGKGKGRTSNRRKRDRSRRNGRSIEEKGRRGSIRAGNADSEGGGRRRKERGEQKEQAVPA